MRRILVVILILAFIGTVAACQPETPPEDPEPEDPPVIVENNTTTPTVTPQVVSAEPVEVINLESQVTQ